MSKSKKVAAIRIFGIASILTVNLAIAFIVKMAIIG